jgi:hypothetical protein
MTKRLKLKTALLLAAATNMTYASESCFPPKSGQTPLEVLECFQSVQDAQQKRISKLEKDNQAQQRIIEEQQATILSLKDKMLDPEMPSTAMIVYNSVANEAGENAQEDANTLAFWQISYQDRFKVKGVPDLRFNYYNPTLYQKGAATYIELYHFLKGKK